VVNRPPAKLQRSAIGDRFKAQNGFNDLDVGRLRHGLARLWLESLGGIPEFEAILSAAHRTIKKNRKWLVGTSIAGSDRGPTRTDPRLPTGLQLGLQQGQGRLERSQRSGRLFWLRVI
jgi:hypothetical protein